MIFLRVSTLCGVCVRGVSGVGKTSVVLRYVQGVYSLDQPSTIGASFMTKRMCVISHTHRSLSSPSLTLNQPTNLKPKNQKIQVFGRLESQAADLGHGGSRTVRLVLPASLFALPFADLSSSGCHSFRSMTPMYYRGASAAILVYDITSVESFECVKDWVNELRTQVQHDIVLAIAGNKSDLEEQRQVKLAKAKEYADSVGAIIYETSAKDNAGIEELFVDVSRRLIDMQNKKKLVAPAGGQSLKQLGGKDNAKDGGGCGC
jgi:GTPase SAR1 family protein